MTPKEKAEELVEKFRIHQPVWEVKDDAKQCALIAVAFALEYVDGTLDEMFDKILYLTEVKNEIEKL